MGILRKIRFVVHRAEDAALILALVSMLVMALTQIVMRNFFDSGFLWAESFLRILVLWVAMLGAMVATRENNHISIDLLSRLLSDLQFRFVGWIAQVFSAAVCFCVAYYCIEYIQYEYEDKTIAFADVPVWVCQSILPIGFAVMGLRFLAGLVLNSKDQT